MAHSPNSSTETTATPFPPTTSPGKNSDLRTACKTYTQFVHQRSYAAFLTATKRRAGSVGQTWNEPSNNVAPAVCDPALTCNSRVTLNIRAPTGPGEQVYVTGELKNMGNWNPSKAQGFTAAQSTASDPLWFADIDLPAATAFEYKYIKKSARGEVVWESLPNKGNRNAETPQECGSTASVDDTLESWE
jgi:glucoamylase